jgi:dTDP-4-dehydrorhamnose reductase
VNAEAPAAMAEAAQRLNAWLLHFSTDYVFDGSGTEPWTEGDPPNPLNTYGRSKLAGEQAIAATGCKHLIFRTSWVYASHGANFLRTMLRLGAERPALRIVDDQIGAPTSANELARASVQILERLQNSVNPPLESGLYHMTCSGSTSWFGFASAIFKRVEAHSKVPSLSPIKSEEYPTPAARPRNSRLNCSKLERATGIRLANWQDALDEVMKDL